VCFVLCFEHCVFTFIKRTAVRRASGMFSRWLFRIASHISISEFLVKAMLLLRVATQLLCYGQASEGSNLLKPVLGCKWSECLSLTVRLVGFRDARM